MRAQIKRLRQNAAGPGDPAASSAAILRLVDADEPPLRALLGTSALGIVRADYESRLASWEKWDDVARLAQG